jgi:ubiquitin carboxyl-terminal hydrolase 34
MTETTALKPYVPVLDSSTRGHLYSVLLALSTDPERYQRLLCLVKDLLPQGEDSNAWQWGVAQILEDFHFEPNWNFERMKSIRAPTGYPGIRNLSNTCYLNSLFTQLFMNVGFRGFMLNTNVADGEASQKLLSETQKLFANMQESWLRCVDPQGIADSVITYDNSPIDVSIQMDVDEFYNLLFDRWESQIPAAADKRTFRKFYGGQIVQQIKSKQCPHMSERLEPFSAIQCEIQNKANLAESLQAYVEGEVMEGGEIPGLLVSW